MLKQDMGQLKSFGGEWGESRKRAHTDHPATPPLEGYSAISGQKERKGKSHRKRRM